MISHDFDFFFGTWRVEHRRLRERLAGCTEWLEFGGTSTVWPTLGGNGNIDDNVIESPAGTYRAVTLRAFDPGSARWAIWWLDGRYPHTGLEPPMIGSFTDGIGNFFADETFNGKPIRVRFLWSHITASSCRWQQAFSPDGGATWETNWVMNFARQS